MGGGEMASRLITGADVVGPLHDAIRVSNLVSSAMHLTCWVLKSSTPWFNFLNCSSTSVNVSRIISRENCVKLSVVASICRSRFTLRCFREPNISEFMVWNSRADGAVDCCTVAASCLMFSDLFKRLVLLTLTLTSKNSVINDCKRRVAAQSQTKQTSSQGCQDLADTSFQHGRHLKAKGTKHSCSAPSKAVASHTTHATEMGETVQNR